MYGLICNPPLPPQARHHHQQGKHVHCAQGGWGVLVGPGGDAHTPRGVTGKGDKVVTAASVATVFASSVLSQQQ